MDENEKVKVDHLASVRLTEDQVKSAIIDMLYQNEEFVSLAGEKKIYVATKWHTDKWSDPDAFVNLQIYEQSSKTLQDNVGEPDTQE